MSPGSRDLACVGVLDGPALRLLAGETSNEVYGCSCRNNHYAAADCYYALKVGLKGFCLFHYTKSRCSWPRAEMKLFVTLPLGRIRPHSVLLHSDCNTLPLAGS